MAAFAQLTTSSISGFVLDPSAKPIPKAKVTVSDASHAMPRSVFTDGAGFYRILNLVPALYEVGSQFANTEGPSLQLEVNDQARIDWRRNRWFPPNLRSWARSSTKAASRGCLSMHANGAGKSSITFCWTVPATTANIFSTESGGNSNYNSLQVSLNRRLARGLTFLAIYTFSKSIDATSAFLADTADPNFRQDSHNYRLDRGLSSFDMTHRP